VPEFGSRSAISVDRKQPLGKIEFHTSLKKGVVMIRDRFFRVHSDREALYARVLRPLWRDDEEVLLQLSVFSATLKPLR
jgi:hypothetical protein